jgi:hypothetical protein
MFYANPELPSQAIRAEFDSDDARFVRNPVNDLHWWGDGADMHLEKSFAILNALKSKLDTMWRLPDEPQREPVEEGCPLPQVDPNGKSLLRLVIDRKKTVLARPYDEDLQAVEHRFDHDAWEMLADPTYRRGEASFYDPYDHSEYSRTVHYAMGARSERNLYAASSAVLRAAKWPASVTPAVLRPERVGFVYRNYPFTNRLMHKIVAAEIISPAEQAASNRR